MDPLDLGPLILAPPQLPLFTLNPPHSAGRSARRGNAFQDWVIAYTLAGFWAGDEDFVVARIEAVEDLDVMLRVEGWWVERYSQIKSRQEGTGNWTLKGLEDEGVLSRFFNLYREFHERSVDQRRRIELVVALEGDLDKDLSEFKRPEGATSEAKAKLFRLLVLSHLVSMDASYKGAARAIGEWCARSGHNLFPEVAAGPGHPRLRYKLEKQRLQSPQI